MLNQANFREILNAKRDKNTNDSVLDHVTHFLFSSSASTESQWYILNDKKKKEETH